METVNKMRMICDPYQKEISYQWYDYNIDKYVDFEPEYSRLASNEFVNVTIQNRAYEIIEVINKECNVGNVGLVIEFVGTESDYNDFCDVLKTFFDGVNIYPKKDTMFFCPAEEVMPKIKERFAKIKGTIEENNEPEIIDLINRYNDAVKPSIALCVIGLYSAGKSTFINSLIGEEVLPSNSDPTTGKLCKIVCSDKYQIRFMFDGKECVLGFRGKYYRPNFNFDKDIIKQLQDILKSDIEPNEIIYMQRALNILNDYKSEKHEIGDIVEVCIPFKKSSLPLKDCNIVIYDTPGSNSVKYANHYEILKRSLDRQTNALPIILTEPDKMDAVDNDRLLQLIEEVGDSLDTTNAIVVVNKADEKGPNALGEKRSKCDQLRITTWKSSRIFFCSSLIGLASKKEIPRDIKQWIDSDFYELFDEKKDKYLSDERKMFEFNIVDQSKRAKCIDYGENEQSHLFINSGLAALEAEISEYAVKYAIYNKCMQASNYIERAIQMCVTEITEDEAELDGRLLEANGSFDEKKKELVGGLNGKKEVLARYNTMFQEVMEGDYQSFIKDNHLKKDGDRPEKEFIEVFKRKWKEYKEEEKADAGKKANNWALSKIQEFANSEYNRYLNSFADYANEHIESFWNARSTDFRNECLTIVHDSDALTPEQKKILESVALNLDEMTKSKLDFNLRKLGAIRNVKILFWELSIEKFDVNECSSKLISNFNMSVSNRITDTLNRNNQAFKTWTNDLISKLTTKLSRFNSDLYVVEQEIKELERKIEYKKKCEKMLNDGKEFIDALLDVQGGNI